MANNGELERMADLATLAEQLKADFQAVDESRWEQLRRYRSIGEKLKAAQDLCPKGEWEKWLDDNFHQTNRQARRYIAFAAEADVTSGKMTLEEAERLWRRLSGNGSRKTRKRKSEEAPDPEPGLTAVLSALVREWIDYLIDARGNAESPEEIIHVAVLLMRNHAIRKAASQCSKRSA
jgi:hypothetical protein